MDKPWKVVLAFVGVFIAGAVFGGLFTLRASGKRLVAATPSDKAASAQVQPVTPKATPPAGIAPALMRQFTQKLKPTAEQKEKITPLVSRAGEDLQRLRQLSRAQDRENLETSTRILERMYEDVAAWLSPEQRIELAEMRRQWQERVAEERKKRSDPVPASVTGRKTDAAKTGNSAKDSTNRKSDGAKSQLPVTTGP